LEPQPAGTSLCLGQLAPGFTLPDLSGAPCRLEDYRGRLVILNFWSAECPWSKRADEQLARLLPGWGQAAALLTIASNANEPPDLLQRTALERGLAPILHDAGQRIADLYGAQTTPHLFAIDAAGILRYQGAFDDVTFRQRTPTQAYLKNAVEALLAGRLPDPAETPPYGCTIVRFTA
jgi:peroxiredoxin